LKQTSHKTGTGFLAIMAHLRYTLYLSLFCHLNHCPTHPGRLITEPKIPQVKKKIIFPSHFWVPAVNIPGCISTKLLAVMPEKKRCPNLSGHNSKVSSLEPSAASVQAIVLKHGTWTWVFRQGLPDVKNPSHVNLTVALANMHW